MERINSYFAIYVSAILITAFILCSHKYGQIAHGGYRNLAAGVVMVVMYGCFYWVHKVGAVLWHQVDNGSLLRIVYEKIGVPLLVMVVILRDELLDNYVAMDETKNITASLLLILLVDGFGFISTFVKRVLDNTEPSKLRPLIDNFPPKSLLDFIYLDLVIVMLSLLFLFGWNPYPAKFG